MKAFIVTVLVPAKVQITLKAENEKQAKEIVKNRGLYWNEEYPTESVNDPFEYFPRIGGGGNEVEYENITEILSVRC